MLAAPLSGASAADLRQGTYLVPGYRVDVATYRGRPVMDATELRRDFPANYQEPGTLLTRVSEHDGSVRRALMPLRGHAVTVAPSGKSAVWASMNGDSFLSLDPESLEIERFAASHGEAFIGGGHAAFSADGRELFVAERKRYGPLPERPEAQFGQVTIRDPATLAVLETYSCHGVSPHQIVLLADGKHLAISNYGSVNQPEPGEDLIIMEPSLTVLELASGKLVEKWIGPDPQFEVRHLAAHRLDRIAAILAREATAEEAKPLRQAREEIYEPDFTAQPEYAYLPAPIQFYDASRPDAPAVATLPSKADDARQGQSILYDPDHDETIVTFASSHRVIVFDAANGRIKKIIPTDSLGLRYPKGIALHPDGAHYAVSGSWRGIHLFRRGSHEIQLERALHSLFFDHSHMAIA